MFSSASRLLKQLKSGQTSGIFMLLKSEIISRIFTLDKQMQIVEHGKIANPGVNWSMNKDVSRAMNLNSIEPINILSPTIQ